MWKLPVNYVDNLEQLKRNIGEIKYSSGIPYYRRLMELKQRDDQRWLALFKEFYKIQGLTTDQRDAVFEYFIQNVNFDQVDLDEILNDCRAITQRNELSFISKLLHTYRPDQFIIYDKFVHAFFNPSGYNDSGELYEILREACNEQGIREIAGIFDGCLGNWDDICELKKIDFMIWGWGKWKNFNEKYQIN